LAALLYVLFVLHAHVEPLMIEVAGHTAQLPFVRITCEALLQLHVLLEMKYVSCELLQMHRPLL
jgi:hypothetical protein